MLESLTATQTTMPTINKDFTITNSTTVDIVVLDGFSDSNGQIYEQTLKPLATKDGLKVIKAGTTGTVTLDDTHKDSTGNDIYSKSYNIIIARADNLYPINSISVRLNDIKQTPPYCFNPVTITIDDAKNMQQAETFQQTIMAYPTSNIAKDWVNTLSGTTASAKSDTDIDDPVEAFFAKYSLFKGVDLHKVVAINTYYSQYPFVWTSYSSSKTYYLYTSDGSASTYVGSVQIDAPSAVPANTDKSLPGFKVTFTDANNQTKNLTFLNGQFVDDANSYTPAICLQGLFILKSQLTKKDGDNTVIPILTGLVNDKKVLGYYEKQQQDSKGNWSGLYTLLHPKDAMGWIQLLMTAGGVIMTIDFLSKGLKSLKDGILETVDAVGDFVKPTPEQVDQIRTEVTDLKPQTDAKIQELLDKMDAKLETMENLQSQIQDRLNEDQRSLLNDTLDSQSEMLEEVLEYGNNSALLEIDDAISGSMDILDNAAIEELPDILPDLKIKIGDVTVKLKVQVERVSSKASQEAKESLDEAHQELEDAEEISDKIDESSEDAASGDVPEDMEFEPLDF